jgi:molecular chaperone GrpE
MTAGDGRPGNGEVPVEGEAGAEAETSATRDDASEATGVELAPEPSPTREAHVDLRRENVELRDQLLRRRADFDNFRRRVERDRLSSGQEAVAGLLTALVPSLDNLERALQAEGGETSLREGLLLIQRELQAALELHGLVVQDPHGARFDPEVHQALSYDQAPGHADGTVVRTFGKAYFHRDRLLRPALVVVARERGPDDGERASGPGGEAAGGAPAEGDTDGSEALH